MLVGATPQRNIQDMVVVPTQLSTASVFGIIVGVLAVIAAVAGAGYFLWQRKVCGYSRLAACLWQDGAVCHCVLAFHGTSDAAPADRPVSPARDLLAEHTHILLAEHL